MGISYSLTFDPYDLNDLVKYIDTYSHLRLDKLKEGDELTIDLRNIRFIRAHGLLFLVMLIKKVFNQTKKKVILSNIPKSDSPKVYGYLERSDFFKVTNQWIRFDPAQDYSDASLYERGYFSPTLMEITHLSRHDYVAGFNIIRGMVSLHAKKILEGLIHLNSFFNILDELVCNVEQWSKGDGY
ncbi:hypothetical protein L0244_33150, partial [bacterium]|nr:hypothetical protein [bacterium]